MNQPAGLRLSRAAPGPDPKHTSSFEFCENGGKARGLGVDRQSAARRSSSPRTPSPSSQSWSDYELEMAGRLTHPMAYDAASDR